MDEEQKIQEKDFQHIHDDKKFTEWIDKTEVITLKVKKERINKTFLVIFLTIVVGTLLMKFGVGIMKDLGMFYGKITLDWLEKVPEDPKLIDEYYSWVSKHPNFVWMFTQFTWLTTFLLSLFLFIRLYRYKKDIPIWFKWITTQRTLSLITVYESLVGVLFWPTVFIKGSTIDWSVPLATVEFLNTFLVHAIIPIILIIYSIIYTVNDKDASLLRKSFVFKGMQYPLMYAVYYVIVSYAWHDPYPLTNFKENPSQSFLSIPLALMTIYFLIGVFMVIHNLLLLKYNTFYDGDNDYDLSYWKEMMKDKIRRKAVSEADRDRIIKEKSSYLSEAINNLRDEIDEINKKHEHMKYFKRQKAKHVDDETKIEDNQSISKSDDSA